MTYLERLAQKEEETLNDRLKVLEEALQNVPEGRLRISPKKNRVNYYRIVDSGDAQGTYIKKADENLVRQLAQKSYNILAYKQTRKNLEAIRNFNQNYSSDYLDQIYDSLSPIRRQLIQPVVPRDEEFIADWLAKHPGYQNPLPFTDETYTAKRMPVRSKTEKFIADQLDALGIPYVYEPKLVLPNYKTIYPDFLILNRRTRKEVYWEHLGMMDDPDYCETNTLKIDAYQKNGYWLGQSLIITFETSKHSLNTLYMQQIIDRYFR